MNAQKQYAKLLTEVWNVRFADFCKVVEAFGCRLDRIGGQPPHLRASADHTPA
jgi:hypothetical protein